MKLADGACVTTPGGGPDKERENWMLVDFCREREFFLKCWVRENVETASDAGLSL